MIAEECQRWQAAYVVMGAYGYGRIMEAFGGVTKRTLANARLPILLGH
ncbi:MAG: universal stress protein [Sphingobium sp.]